MTEDQNNAMNVFDRNAVRRHRDRAAAKLENHDFLFRECADRLIERLDDIKRDFPLALDLGCHGGEVADLIKGRKDVGTLVQCDYSEGMAARAATSTGLPTMVADEETLPLAAASLDLVLSNLSLHWVNDLPGTFLQVRKALKPDGLFHGAVLGGQTLGELRTALAEAEMDVSGGVRPRVSPFADVKDIGNLLQRAGFALPVVDTEFIPVSYGEPFRLLTDLRGMGESNAVLERQKSFTSRRTLMLALSKYMDRFADPDGRMPVTFQVIFFAAWTPDPSQQQPLAPGSAIKDLSHEI